jgi:hypothetical protein
MKPVLRCGLAVLLGVAPVVPSASEAGLSSRRDHSLNVNRDLPIACKPGDLQRMPSKTMGEAFGVQWPAQPEPETPLAHVEARLLAVKVPAGMTRGLPPQSGLVVAAVLVDGQGKALKVVPICATDEGYDVATTRILMRGTYQPATVNAQPITSVAMVVYRYRNSLYQGSGER